MKLPKYEMFSIIGIINLLIGIFLCKWLLAKGINDLCVLFLMFFYYIVIIYLYKNLQIELEVSFKKYDKEDHLQN